MDNDNDVNNDNNTDNRKFLTYFDFSQMSQEYSLTTAVAVAQAVVQHQNFHTETPCRGAICQEQIHYASMCVKLPVKLVMHSRKTEAYESIKDYIFIICRRRIVLHTQYDLSHLIYIDSTNLYPC